MSFTPLRMAEYIRGRIHRVLLFKQANWLAPYIILNSNKRQAASSNFEEKIYKLMRMQFMAKLRI